MNKQYARCSWDFFIGKDDATQLEKYHTHIRKQCSILIEEMREQALLN